MRTDLVHRRRWHRHTRSVLGVMASAAAVVLGGLSCTTSVTMTAASTACVFRTSPGVAPAFCDGFDQPAGTGNRAGDLNGVVWGASRATSNDNPSQGVVYNWADAGENQCGTNRTVQPEQDIAICNGQVVEAVNDNTAVTALAIYPKQPFDFAGRTGTVTFDVSDNTQGTHAAWPAFVLTDQPVPAPYGSAAGLSDNARNSIGFSMAAACGQYGCGGSNNPPGYAQPGFACVGVDAMFLTSNYQERSIPFNTDGCVLPSKAVGSNNHVEVQLSSSGMKVYASDPGQPSTTRLIADASFTAPLTRGLIWLEDVHYNAGKDNTQQTDTFSWDNVGFDGPVLARDLAFDVPDALTAGQPAENGLPTVNLGYYVPPGQALSLNVPGVTGTANASAALLTMTYWAHNSQTLTYTVNGHAAHTMPWPFGSQSAFVSQTVAMPVPLGEVQAGSNTVQFTTSDPDGVSVANIDLILVGAGGVPATPTPAPSSTPSPTPAPTPRPSPVSITNVPCTVVIQSQSQSGTCSGTFTPK